MTESPVGGRMIKRETSPKKEKVERERSRGKQMVCKGRRSKMV